MTLFIERLTRRMLILVLMTFVASALAGSECPPRENIYPCTCLALKQSKTQFFTSVSCHRLHSTDSLASIVPSLKAMAIDHFYLYDSFWETSDEQKQVLPTDWLTTLKIKEIEIVDTTLSPCFACNARMNCRNDVTTRFTAVNSSSHEKICTLCDSKSGQKYGWVSCMKRLKEFHFRKGGLTIIRSDLFPMAMAQLTDVDLSFNSISKIETNAFKNLNKLRVLNLAHNALQDLSGMAQVKMSELQQLDVSWNMLAALGTNYFSGLPKLKTILLSNNYFAELKEDQWAKPPDSLRTIDLRENPIHCDCSLQWVNTTLHINTVIQGHCISPEEFEGSQIRRASRLLNERCTDDGEIGTRSRKPTAVTKAMFVPE